MQRVLASSVEFKGLAYERCASGININLLGVSIVEVSRRRSPAPLAAPQLLSDAALHVLAQIIHVVLALTESNIEHELSLRYWLKPEGREPQGLELFRIEEIDDLSTIHRVPCEPVGVPGQNPFRFPSLNLSQHFREHGSSGFFGGFRLLEGGGNFKVFSGGQLSQLRELRFDGERLTLLTLR